MQLMSDDPIEDLLMLSTQPKTKPEPTNPYSDHNNDSVVEQRPLESPLLVSSSEIKHRTVDNSLKPRESEGVYQMTTSVTNIDDKRPDRAAKNRVKKVRVGEIRIRAQHLKDLVDSHSPRRGH